MNVAEFKRTLEHESPPDVGELLRALWLDARGDWDGAHGIAQDSAGRDGAWVHAYLHRKEGDHPNAAYWYRRAQREPCSGSLEEEWDEIVGELL
jgi:hypothetical protein